MALLGARVLLKCNQLLSEAFMINSRSLIVSQKCYTTTAQDQKEPEETSPPPELPDFKKELDKVTLELNELTVKNTELLDKYKRSLADGENMRLRLTKQISEAKMYGIQSFCKDLLDVADVLNKATETVPKDEVSEKNPHLKSLYEGLLMTEAQLQAVFKRHGLEPVNPLNEKFDPNYHEALFQQEVQGKESGTVVVVSKVGYKLHERVIRPALVGVSK